MSINVDQPSFGIDISHHQKVTDWDALVAVPTLEWVYCKASEGKTYRDPKFKRFVTELATRDMPVGAYHYARPGNNTAREDAENFLGAIATVGGQKALSLVPMLDFEEANDNVPRGQEALDWIVDWLNIVGERTGFNPILYTGPNVLAKLGIKDMARLPNTILWVPRYPNTKPQSLDMNTQAVQLFLGGTYDPINRLPNWQTDIWQYTGHGQIDGISNLVDMNLTDSETLQAMLTRGVGGGSGTMMGFAIAAVVAAYMLNKDR